MKYADISKGKTVLYSPHRTSSSAFRLSGCVLAEVLATGQEHSYWTKGSFSEAGKHRTTSQGVKIRLTSGPDEGTELVTMAGYLTDTSYEHTMEAWRTARVEVEIRERQRAEARAARERLADRFKAAGFDVAVVSTGAVTFSSVDAPRLIALLERINTNVT